MVSEFEFIEKLKSRYSLNKIGDDCSVLPKDADTDLLLTVDMLVEDIDFRLEWTTPELLGHKSLAVSLSDIAAMGGDPKWAMVSVGIPESLWETDFLNRLYAGFMLLAAEFKVDLVGGDLSKTPDKVVIDSIVGGSVAKGKAILRSGAKPQDAIFITGTLGAAAGGLKLLENGARLGDSMSTSDRGLLLRQLQPRPQLLTAKLLNQLNIVTAMIDVSDGLSSDLVHLCRASNVGARIDAKMLPLDPSLTAHSPPHECLEMTLNGGEDFQLLFTADKNAVARANIVGITQIGEVTSNDGTLELLKGNVVERLLPNGFRHF